MRNHLANGLPANNNLQGRFDLLQKLVAESFGRRDAVGTVSRRQLGESQLDQWGNLAEITEPANSLLPVATPD